MATALGWVAFGTCVAATPLADLRWLRVAQREHYLGGSVTRFARRWWSLPPLNPWLFLVALAGAAASFVASASAIVTASAVVAGPAGLGLRGRTSQLAWTRRLRVLAAVTVCLQAAIVGFGAAVATLRGAVVAVAFACLVAPLFVDCALWFLAPVENLLAERFVRTAKAVLARVKPVVVGVTGSYGKTSTKNYIAHLLAHERAVVASPRSFNNRSGLSRTVNEHLGAGTEVLVAEMGAYGPGEIADLCVWLQPQISVITSIGPAHLERFGTLEATLEAKSEIALGARVVVLNVDDDRLRELAKRLESRQKVVRASGGDPGADVVVLGNEQGLELVVAGDRIGVTGLEPGSSPPIRSNAACAAAVALELGVAPLSVLARLGSLPAIPNRLQRQEAAGGYVVLDDTFNSNPAGARHALEVLAAAAPEGRRVLVTPGMVELGGSQRRENEALAELAAAVVTDLVVVGRSNRTALVCGWRNAGAAGRLKTVSTRQEAVAWTRQQLVPGDAVLFENDLPDHFP